MSSDQQQQEHSYVWFQLVDSASGKPYKGTSAGKVAVSSSANVYDLLKAVKAELSHTLSSFDPVQLRVYKNKSAFDKRNLYEGEGKEENMDFDDALGLLGSKDDMLVVVVPSSEYGFPDKEPHPKRKERWIALNKILERNAKKYNINDSTAYSFATWNQVKFVVSTPTEYVQPRRDMDEAQLDLLTEYIFFTTKCIPDSTTDATRLHFIAPILISVCSLLGGNVDLLVEKDLVGTFFKANAHVEFMFKRGRKAVCIVLAETEDFEQGMAQDLLACEVAAENGGLDIAYGIVTDYTQWNFLRSLNDKVEMEVCSLNLTPEGPERNSLKIIAEKIYAMLS